MNRRKQAVPSRRTFIPIPKKTGKGYFQLKRTFEGLRLLHLNLQGKIIKVYKVN